MVHNNRFALRPINDKCKTLMNSETILTNETRDDAKWRWILLSSGVFIKPRFYPIEMIAMGSTRSHDEQQEGEQCKYPGHG